MATRAQATREEILGQTHPASLPHKLSHDEMVLAWEHRLAALCDVGDVNPRVRGLRVEAERHLAMLRAGEHFHLPPRDRFTTSITTGR